MYFVYGYSVCLNDKLNSLTITKVLLFNKAVNEDVQQYYMLYFFNDLHYLIECITNQFVKYDSGESVTDCYITALYFCRLFLSISLFRL